MSVSLFGLDPATWTPHELHGPEREYVETNCYADVIIELVAAAGHEPTAMLGGTATADFEHDQWTFFKPAPGDLWALYGLDIHEMQPRDLPNQIAERLSIGQTLIPELDGWWLPDTRATSYHREHVKTSVVAEAIDLDARTFRYFHNAGYYELAGEDFEGVFAPLELVPYVDLARFVPGAPADVRGVARELLSGHLARRPHDNPWERFGARLSTDLPGLLEAPEEDYHAYAFATARMAGAAFELLASHARWLFDDEADSVVADLGTVVSTAKMLSFRLARRREFDVEAVTAGAAAAWATAMSRLDDLATR